MPIEKLLERAKGIIKEFDDLSKQEEQIKQDYFAYKEEIIKRHNEKNSEIEIKNNQRIGNIIDETNNTQKNIQEALNALSELESLLPEKYFYYSLPNNIQPEKPDFQYLNDLIVKINEYSYSGVTRFFKEISGDKSIIESVNDFRYKLEAGRLFLKEEQKKCACYLTQEKNKANNAIALEKDKAEQEKNNLLNQKDYLLNQQINTIHKDMLLKSNSSTLSEFDKDLLRNLERIGALEESWNEFKPSNIYPDEMMIGAIKIPFILPKHVGDNVRKKMPISYNSGDGLFIPISVDKKEPLCLLINYSANKKTEVMGGIQSIILKWVKYMPLNSFSITFIDPNDRGSNLGKLQKLEEISSWDLCKHIYASKEDIVKRLKELEKFVDVTCSRLAGINSVYDYNYENETAIIEHLIIINDYPDNFERQAEESLEVLIKNSYKCGISMIFTKSNLSSKVPDSVMYSFRKIDCFDSCIYFGIDGEYEFQFDTLSVNTDSFLEKVISSYNNYFRVDNSFSNYFLLETNRKFRESTQAIEIPFAVDSKKRLIEIELGGALTAHALLSGHTGSGKTATLHMLIISMVLNYHPDDVELWLVDYNKVAFVEYISNCPPHVKMIGLERSSEFSFSLLDKINEECQNRMELFKNSGVSDITEYKMKFGVRSLPRIVLIIDEFHQLTQAIRNNTEYTLVLENILSEYRKFGLSCVFSDQAMGDGLRGLTEKGKKQISTRIAMANDISEIRETLAIDNTFYDDSLRNKINTMDPGDVIFKRSYKDSSGENNIYLDRYRTIYVHKDERIKCIQFIRNVIGEEYKKKDVLIVEGEGRKQCRLKDIEKFEQQHGGPKSSHIPIYLGHPSNFNPCFCIYLQDRLDSNIMLIGSDMEMRASIIMNTIYCFSRLTSYEVIIFADLRDELFIKYQKEINSLLNKHITLVTNSSEIGNYVDGLLDAAREGKTKKTLMVWLGIESIGSDLSLLPKKANEDKTFSNSNAINDLMSEIDSMLAEYEEKSEIAISTKRVEKNYDCRDEISDLLSNGSRFGIHSLVTFPSVKMIKQSRFVKTEFFEHKIAFSMSRDDWSNYMERVHYPEELNSISAVYYDGSSTHIFRPYLI